MFFIIKDSIMKKIKSQIAGFRNINYRRRLTIYFNVLLSVLLINVITSFSAYSQSIISIEASSGSHAPFGNNQFLRINAEGKVSVYKKK